MKTIEITFGEEVDAIRVEAKGYQGHTCLQDTRPFEEILGVAGERHLKREFHQHQGSLQQQGGGR